MARARMVTRTVSKTVVVVLCVDTLTAEPKNAIYDISGVYPDDAKGNKKLLETIRKNYETETFKIVSIVSKEVKEDLYGMSEQKFIETAEILPPREAKPEAVKEAKPNKKNNK